MSDLKLISPLLDDFDTGGSISEHHGVHCYPAMRKETTDRYIIKKESVPSSQTKVEALLLTGAYPDAASALEYFKENADRTVSELETLQRLSELEGFYGYDAWQVVQKEAAVGYDVYMIGSYKYSLRKFLQHNPATHLSSINLGLDICAALSVARRLGFLYVDLKPNNIFVADDRTFKIGDIGFLSLDTLQYATLPDKYCSEYTAPEATDAFSTLNSSLDIYALGLILYQIYNGGELPSKELIASGEKLPEPAFADYEIAEIILKACNPVPENRWQDPIEMAQALVAYMQRNGANDSPIVPVKVLDNDSILTEDSFEDEIAESIDTDSSESIQILAKDKRLENDSLDDAIDLDELNNLLQTNLPDTPIDDDSFMEDSFGNLSFLDNLLVDETSPENNLSEVSYDEITDELSDILTQADELVALDVPEPVVAPEGTAIDEIAFEDDSADVDENQEAFFDDSEEDSTDEENQDENAEPLPSADVSMDETVVVSPINVDSEAVDESVSESDETVNDSDADEVVNTKKNRVTNWILTAIIFLLIAAIAAVGVYYYKTIYLLQINDISVDGNESSMVVFIDTEIDETLLSVVCSDSHGNQISAPVVGGTATFANLSPDTAYNVKILVDGFHRLTGETAASYSTPAQTNVVQFSAVTGAESGSVILSFTLEGPDTENWQIRYSAPNEEEITVDALSHMATLTGLTVGKEYTFTLIPSDDMYVSGITEITFTASDLVFAENVAITSCLDGKLTAVWDSPENIDVSGWTVRCYNDADYNQSTITTENSVVFENIDPSYNYTVEVIAAGMSSGELAFMSKDALTIQNFTADTSNPEAISLSWESSQEVPGDGWVLLYSVDGSDSQGSVVCLENNAVITPVIPDATYTFKIQQADGTAVLTDRLACQTAAPQDFSGYGMTRETMSFQMCKAPAEEEWSRTMLKDEDFTSSFVAGERIALLGKLDGRYASSDDTITSLFVIRDLDGNLITYSSQVATWNDMWNQSYAEIDVPVIPTESGDYTLTVYFNGKFVSQKAFTISN